MNVTTRVFLVLLRLAIGWHFLFEGIDKLGSETWTSEAYLREARGPFADYFRDKAGDSVLERVKPLPVPAGQEIGKTPPHTRIPPALKRDWQAYFDQFVAYYDLDADQRKKAQAKFEQQQDQVVNWMTNEDWNHREWSIQIETDSPYGPYKVTKRTTIPEMAQEYEGKWKEIRQLESSVGETFGALTVADQIQSLKDEANLLRRQMRTELDKQTKKMQAALSDVLTPEQQDQPPLAIAQQSMWAVTKAKLTQFPKMTPLERADVVVAFGLTIIGLLLLAGLLTRTACVAGAAFLVLTYLPMPPFPWLPEVPRSEGHYVFVNKNVIEFLALMALATTRSGRWLGLDALLPFLNPFRRRAAPETRREEREPALAR
ncbi:MAG: hypothetical protein ACK4RK_00925 [Gemmataceae bacterium]